MEIIKKLLMIKSQAINVNSFVGDLIYYFSYKKLATVRVIHQKTN